MTDSYLFGERYTSTTHHAFIDHKLHTILDHTIVGSGPAVLEKAQAIAMGAIEKDKRLSERAKNGDQVEKVKALEEKARAAGDDWAVSFAKSIADRLEHGGTLSVPQENSLKQNFGKYRIAHDENGFCDPNCACHKTGFDFPTPEALKKYLHIHPKADPANHSVEKKEPAKKQPATNIRDESPEKLRSRIKELQDDLSKSTGLDPWSKEFPERLLSKLDKGEKFTEKDWQRLHGDLWTRKLSERVVARFLTARENR